MNKRVLMLSLVFMVFASIVAFAQNGTVRGKVVDKKSGDALPGARVILTPLEGGNPIGRVAGKDGSFELSVKAGTYDVKTSYVGYKVANSKVTVDAGGTATVEFQLVADVRGLDEVVVTGVASRTQKAVAEVAVSRVNAAEFSDKVGYTSAGQLLSGKVAGVTITPASGQVGGGIRFNVRSGAGLIPGNPVIFVDGVRVNAGTTGNGTVGSPGFGSGGQGVSALADLNPNDIENIEVLKGPAASALYGTSGQNGVVLITTKRGKNLEAGDLRISYQGIFGVNQASRQFTEQQLLSFRQANAIFRDGPIQQHAVNLQGQSGIFNYFAGFEDRREEGFVIQNSLRRQSVRLNLEAVTSKDITINANANYIQNTVSRPQNDNNVIGWQGNTRIASPFSNPTATVANRAPRSTYIFTDSAAIAAFETETFTSRFVGSADITYSPSFIPGLRFKGIAGYDYRFGRDSRFAPSNFTYAGVTRGQRGIINFTQENLNFDLSAVYDTKIADVVNSTTIIGSQLFDRVLRSSTVSAQNFPTELIRDVGAGDATTRLASESFLNTREAGVFARQEMNIDQTYFLSGGLRWDFASAVGALAPNIFYPQVSGMVRLDKLGFLPEVFNLMKLRVAYGQTGRLPALQDGQALLWTALPTPYGAGAVVNNAGNPAIQPERIAETEFGIEFELDNAYGAEFTYYLSNTSQALVSLPRAPSTGLGNKPTNVARIDGWGFESRFYARPLQTREFSLDIDLIVNYADNIVQDLGFDVGGPAFLQDGFNRNFLIPGQRRSQFMGLRPLAPRFTATGHYSYLAAAVNRPGQPVGLIPGASGPIIDTTGVVRTPLGLAVGYPIGPSAPLFTGSFSFNFRFFTNFTLYALAEYGLGGYIYDGTTAFNTNPAQANNLRFNTLATQLGIFGSGVPATAPNAATDRGPSPQVPVGRVPGVDILTPGTPEYQRAAEEFMRLDPRIAQIAVANFTYKADWVRLREVSLRWNATSLVNDIFNSTVKNLSFTLSGNNLLLFTNYPGIEVELNANPFSALSQGQDFLTLQQQRTINFMVSFGF
jgi:TonB-dependent SusC/RagA subfamily outer membrane receptor